MNKSASETDINVMGTDKTPPNFVYRRTKRNREEISVGLQLDEFKEEMRKMMSLFTEKREKELHEIKVTLNEIQQSNINIDSSISFLTGQFEELKKKVNLLENQDKENKQYITILEDKIEDIQMGCRKTNFVIKNVPKKANESKEDLIDMVMCLSNSVNCKIGKYDVKDIYRVRGKNNDSQNMPIVVESSSTLLKTEILKMGKAFNIKHKTKLCAKHLGFKVQEDTPIFIAEHLTPKASRLHFLARDLSKSGAYKFCWTAYGKVYLKKDEQSPTIIIKSEAQIHQLTQGK